MECTLIRGTKIMTGNKGHAPLPQAILAATLFTAAACGGGDSGSAGSGEASDTDANPASAAATEPVDLLAGLDPALLPEGVTVAMVEQGRDLFNGGGICYTCHTVEATGGPLAPDLTDDTWINVDGEYQSIIELVKTGVSQPIEHPGAMLPRAGMPLTDEQVEAVSAYAYILSRL